MTDRYMKNKAEIVALNIIEYIFSNDQLKGEFLSLTGISEVHAREYTDSPEFLSGAMDFLLANEEELIQFCEQFGYKPDDPLFYRGSIPVNASLK